MVEEKGGIVNGDDSLPMNDESGGKCGIKRV